jgi:hypothetical protein
MNMEQIEQTEQTEQTEQIKVLYNDCYGGWSLSDKAKELYKIRKLNIDNSNKLPYLTRRSDPILIQIFDELGNEFDGKYSRTNVDKIDKKYEYYYDIEEYDGKENVIIDYKKYELDKIKNKIKEILKSDLNNDQKINEIEQFIYMRFDY